MTWSTVRWLAAAWLLFSVAFVLGCWWAGSRRERREERAYKAGWDEGRSWQRLEEEGGDWS